ncbi:DUF1559 family PulG-like putative transporter [Aeoliella sp. SH292]|uniref:DUF1559 family PulG-like putative transporter n=1 Tax=Aeoliella sp. SH292 TaxID=3454464 RepID=UPI003F9694FA
MSFRITTLLYLFALVAASLAVFGAWGILVAAVLGVINWKLRPGGLSHLLTVAVVLTMCYLAFAVHHARDYARATTCYGHLYYTAFHLELYHDTHGRLPPPSSTVPPSAHLHSWRALLSPIMETQIGYDFSQRWDGPFNRALPAPNSYQCPTHAYGVETHCFAIVGPETAWGDGTPRTFADITDGREQTILLLEASNQHIDWKEPRDLTFDEALALLTEPVDPANFDGHLWSTGPFRKPTYYRSAIMADRSHYKLRAPLPRELATALLTATGGEQVDLNELKKLGEPEWDYARIGNTIAFVAIVLLPFVPAARRRIWPEKQFNLQNG